MTLIFFSKTRCRSDIFGEKRKKFGTLGAVSAFLFLLNVHKSILNIPICYGLLPPYISGKAFADYHQESNFFGMMTKNFGTIGAVGL